MISYNGYMHPLLTTSKVVLFRAEISARDKESSVHIWTVPVSELLFIKHILYHGLGNEDDHQCGSLNTHGGGWGRLFSGQNQEKKNLP